LGIGILVVDRRENEIFLENIWLTSAWQGQGLGSEIIRRLMREASASGLPLTLQVLKPNPARRLYERLGFQVVGETATHLRMKWQPAG
jgi:ribosomal protein S18 acetylase RimI-like enzyme